MRPLSPHLTIYKPQITSMLSISHRISGVFLFLGILALSWWTIMSVYQQCNCLDVIFKSIFGKIILFFWSQALFYHMLNGVRHLFWDIGKGFELKTLNNTGIIVFVGSIFLNIFVWSLVLF